MWACNRETFILYFQSETARTNLFLGYFAHIVRREQDGIIAKDLYKSKVLFWGDVFVDVTVVDLKVPKKWLGKSSIGKL